MILNNHRPGIQPHLFTSPIVCRPLIRLPHILASNLNHLKYNNLPSYTKHTHTLFEYPRVVGPTHELAENHKKAKKLNNGGGGR